MSELDNQAPFGANRAAKRSEPDFHDRSPQFARRARHRLLLPPRHQRASAREDRTDDDRARRRASMSTTTRARNISRAWRASGASRSASASSGWSQAAARADGQAALLSFVLAQVASAGDRAGGAAGAAWRRADRRRRISPRRDRRPTTSSIKLVWYYNNALGRPEKKKIISRQKGYHGVSIASGSLTGLPTFHRDFDLPLPIVQPCLVPALSGASACPARARRPSPTRSPTNSRRMILDRGRRDRRRLLRRAGDGGRRRDCRRRATYWEKMQAVCRARRARSSPTR